MKLNLVSKREAPEGPYETELICFSTDLIPYAFGALWLRSQKYWWKDPDDWRVARIIIAEQASHMLQGCTREITNRQDALYSLLDATLRGVGRTVTGDGTEEVPYVYSPPIPPAATPQEGLQPSLLSEASLLLQVSDNAFNGTPYEGLPATNGLQTNVQAIRDALEAGGFDPTEIEGILNAILLALG